MSLLVENNYFKLYLRDNDVILHAFEKGYPLKSFDLILREFPRLKMTSFTNLRTALIEIGEEHIIGTWLPLVEISVAQNKMTVEMVCNATIDQLQEDRSTIIAQANASLDKIGIVFGRKDLDAETIVPGKAIIVAEGQEPVKGDDAIATYIEVPERKPVIREDGSADHYEMNFVFPIEEEEWLGEKTLPQEGINGSDVYGNEIIAARGADTTLRYDKKSVFEQQEEDVVVLRALYGGALNFIDGGVVSVDKHLAIQGDVGVKTGSITFDGSVSVAGTIHAGYSVIATGDVSIEGNEGVTNAKMIQSSEGDIYIKGGLFGGGETIVEAKGSIYVKHSNNCKLFAKEVHVGLYLFGTEVVAEEVYVDNNRGRIIGGTVEALYTIETAIVGNNHERTTYLTVKGVNQTDTLKEVQEMAKNLKENQQLVRQLQERVDKLKPLVHNLYGPQKEAYDKSLITIEQKSTEILQLDREIQHRLARMKSAKEATIKVSKEAFPGTSIQIGKSISMLQKNTKGIFKIENGVLNV